MSCFKADIMDEQTTLRCIRRMAHEIVEKNKGTDGICLVGIKTRGEHIADLLAQHIEKIEGCRPECGFIDIKFYRDDVEKRYDGPVVKQSALPFSVTDKKIILVDDVLFTGRTVRAAIEAVFAEGRPGLIQLAILIDRGHRELPIRADYIGKSVATSKKEFIRVNIPPADDCMGVKLYENN